MAGTYSKIYIQIVFAVKGRQNLIAEGWQTDLHKYIAGIIKGKGQKPIIVNGMSDHIHVFVGMKPSIKISDLVRDIKNNSTNYVNKHNWIPGKFCWQGGYGAFSYSESQIDAVYNYILNQKEHHRKRTFREEYHGFLERFDVDYHEKYLFDWYE